eukprot:2512111-Pleurochrysis_carterae.AAC.1
MPFREHPPLNTTRNHTAMQRTRPGCALTLSSSLNTDLFRECCAGVAHDRHGLGLEQRQGHDRQAAALVQPSAAGEDHHRAHRDRRRRRVGLSAKKWTKATCARTGLSTHRPALLAARMQAARMQAAPRSWCADTLHVAFVDWTRWCRQRGILAFEPHWQPVSENGPSFVL